MIIDAIAKRIERKVDLDNPDKIVLVEVIGQLAGLSLISSNDILSIEREKRKA
jgi:tRNA acetyltransferase TAN1